MWARLLRILSASLNAWRFSANPVAFILSVLMVFATPYLIYLFWGSIIMLLLAGLGLFLGIRFILQKTRNHTSF
jgi:hypothetical protein